MLVKCEKCGKQFDDARRSTLCAHDPFLSEAELAQKDLAMTLLGQNICFNHHAPHGAKYRVQSVTFEGMVTIDGLPGEFAPHLFVIVA